MPPTICAATRILNGCSIPQAKLGTVWKELVVVFCQLKAQDIWIEGDEATPLHWLRHPRVLSISAIPQGCPMPLTYPGRRTSWQIGWLAGCLYG